MPKKISIIAISLLLLPHLLKAKTDQTLLGKSCQIDSQCSPPYITCRKNQCMHKALFPMNHKEIIGLVILLSLCLLSAASGIGGGALIVPLLLIFFDFSTKEAIAFSNGMIFFTGIIKFFVALQRNHPTLDHKTLIDYNVVMIFIPTLLLGSFLGSTIATIMPDFLQLVGLILVIIFAIYKSFVKSLELWKKESIELLQEKYELRESDVMNLSNGRNEIELRELESQLIGDNSQLIHDENENQDNIRNRAKTPEKDQEAYTEEELKIHKEIEKIESDNFYPKKFSISIGIFLISILVILLRGGKGLKSIIGIKKCEPLDWIIIIIYTLIVILFMTAGNLIVLREQELKERYRWRNLNHPDEKKFTKTFIMESNILAILIGFVAAIVGVGGGMILNPMLLTMNFLPQIVSFTGMYPTVINKLVASSVFMIAGVTPVGYLFFTGILLSIGVVFVEWKIAKLVKRLGRQSIISFLFAGILTVAFGLTVYVGWINTERHLEAGKGLLEFKDFCG